ncbi:MAG TPA: amidase [Solirubrobacteraceae bacterium]
MTDAATAADLMFRPASELAGLVRSGELSAREVVEASLQRIDALNPTYNAFIDVFHDDALAAADAVGPGDERPLAGVPIAIKNNRPVAGKRWTFASEFFGDFLAPLDAVLVTRLRAAGAIIVGTTNLPELGIVNTTEPRRFGPSRNPWDPERTTGGSSGGAAAAVAAGMIPIAHANDGGGSTRIPAACCGLVGLKAQRGRVTPAPFGGYSFLGIDGVLTRTVNDTAVALDVIAGPDVGDVAWAAPPATPFAGQAQAEPRGLRIALTTLSPVAGAEADPVYVQAVADAADLLRDLGHTVVEADPPWAMPGLEDMFGALWAPMISLQTAFAAQIAGREPTDEDLEPLTMALWNAAREIDALSYAGAEIQLQAAAKGIVQWTAQYDAILCPVLAEPQLPLGTIDTCSADPMTTGFHRAALFTPFTPVSNLTGSPAISVPLYHRDDLGLPVPIQLIGQPEGEGALLALAAQLERALPWAARRAAV